VHWQSDEAPASQVVDRLSGVGACERRIRHFPMTDIITSTDEVVVEEAPFTFSHGMSTKCPSNGLPARLKLNKKTNETNNNAHMLL